MTRDMMTGSALIAALLMLAACGDDGSDGTAQGTGGASWSPAQGAQGGGCRPDGSCEVGLTCNSGLCEGPAATGGSSSTGGATTGGAMSTGGVVSTAGFDLNTDCQTDCPSQGLICCGGRCVNTNNDIYNCGGCGAGCTDDALYCQSGTCTTTPCTDEATPSGCPQGQLCCIVNEGGPSGPPACYPPVDDACPLGCPQCDCASADTLVATPSGDVPIHAIAPGDIIFSIDGDAIVAVPVLAINRMAVSNHVMVRVRLEGGAIVEMSPRHPTIDGMRFDRLRVGDSLGDVIIERIDIVPYPHDHTYDLLPATESAAYFAAGTVVGSTLKR